MALALENIQTILCELDQALAKLSENRILIVCGGSALLVVDLIDRTTRDIDVITPELDTVLKDLATLIGKRHGLEEGWLNNGPASLARDLEPGWKNRTESIFQGVALRLESLGKRDLLASKLFAFCDRDEQDLDDIWGMAPSWSEVESLRNWLLDRDASVLWPRRVETRLLLLKRKLSHE
ncbi:DUF6036 family nucleotidyltransferase [Bdellovibrionota bacterium FG-1]